MPGSGRDVAVLQAALADEADWRTDPGGSAVLHGLLATMAEVLERLDTRLAGLEAGLAERVEEREAAATRVVERMETVVSRLAEHVAGGLAQDIAAQVTDAVAAADVRASLGAVHERLGEVEARIARPDTSALEARLADVAEAVARLGERVEAASTEAVTATATAAAEAAAQAVADAMPDAPAPTIDLDALAAAVDDRLRPLGDRLDEVRAVTRSLARLEAAVAESRAEASGAVQAVGDRVQEVARSQREASEDVLAKLVQAVDALVGNAGRIEGAVADLERRVAEPAEDSLAGLAGRLADGMSRLQEAVNRSRGESVAAVGSLGDTLAERLAALEGTLAGKQAFGDGPASDAVAALEELGTRIARLEALVQSLDADEEARAAKLGAELQSLLGAGMERLLTQASQADEMLTADLRGTLQRLSELGAGIEGLNATVGGLGEQVGRLASDERARPIVAAVEQAAREQQEAVVTLQTALVRRIDGRTAALARLLEGVGDLGPLVQRLAGKIDDQETRGREVAESLRTVAETVQSQLGSLREDLDQTVSAISRRLSATLKLLERVGGELGDEQRRLETVQSLCQSVAAAVEQQAAVGGRVAELVLETRAAMRGDVERVESAVQLEAVKSRQQDQARLAQVTANVTEVVEREASLVGQRVAALAGAVEAVRAALHSHSEDALRAQGTQPPASKALAAPPAATPPTG